MEVAFWADAAEITSKTAAAERIFLAIALQPTRTKRVCMIEEVLARRGKHLAPCASPLERKIDRTFTDWSRTMTNASVNSDHMPRQELDSSVVKINEQAAFQCQKTLIGVGMTVPMISLSHSAYTNFMIVDFSHWMVIVALRRC
jgi:hypothetical protein